jgi:hypothetical protein
MALTDGMTPDEIQHSEARYNLHVSPVTAEWLEAFAAGFKGTKADVAAFAAVRDALRSSYADGNEPDGATGQTAHALYLPLFDGDGVACETVMNRVLDVLNKRSGRSKADKSAIAELRVELLGAIADVEVRPVPAPVILSPVPAGTVPADVAPVTVPDAVAEEAPAPVKVKRTRKAKAAPAPVAPVVEESAPVAADAVVPVMTPGDAVAAVAVKVGGMLNKWSKVTEGVARMTMAERKRAAGELARDFAECVALQADADGAGNSLGSLDGDANRIMHAARKILRNAYALLSGDPRVQADRLSRSARHTFRRAVGPWRADATAALVSAQ